MARLNEDSSAVDQVELIKRRVMRQNHELAKANSRLAQAVRSATADTTRVEADNLELRQIIAHLESQLSHSQLYPTVTRIDQIKSDLQDRLDELGSLIATIGAAKTARPSTSRENALSCGDREPQFRYATPPYGLSTIGEHTKLQLTVPESDQIIDRLSGDDSCFIQEIKELQLSQPPSPEFASTASPTKSFIVHTDEEVSQHSADDDTNESDIPDVLVNLELRRRRKDSSSRSGRATSLPSFDSPHDTVRIPKRKSMRESEDLVSDLIIGDFTYSKRASTSKHDLSIECVDAEIQPDANMERLHDTGPIERKVLGNKSVNLSPQKRSSHDSFKAKLDPAASKETEKEAYAPGIGKKKQPRIPRTSHPRSTKAKEAIQVAIEPATLQENPPVCELPETSEELTARTATAIFDAVKASSEEYENSPATQETATRPSRRARGAVSYAEPSLNSKMRRPSKILVDAVYKASSDGTNGPQDHKTDDADPPSRSKRRSSLNRTSTSSRRSKSSDGMSSTNHADDSTSLTVNREATETTKSCNEAFVEKDESGISPQVAALGTKGRTQSLTETEIKDIQASPSASRSRRSISACYGPASSTPFDVDHMGIAAGASSRRSTVV